MILHISSYFLGLKPWQSQFSIVLIPNSMLDLCGSALVNSNALLPVRPVAESVQSYPTWSGWKWILLDEFMKHTIQRHFLSAINAASFLHINTAILQRFLWNLRDDGLISLPLRLAELQFCSLAYLAMRMLSYSSKDRINRAWSYLSQSTSISWFSIKNPDSLCRVPALFNHQLQLALNVMDQIPSQINPRTVKGELRGTTCGSDRGTRNASVTPFHHHTQHNKFIRHRITHPGPSPALRNQHQNATVAMSLPKSIPPPSSTVDDGPATSTISTTLTVAKVEANTSLPAGMVSPAATQHTTTMGGGGKPPPQLKTTSTRRFPLHTWLPISQPQYIAVLALYHAA